MDLDRVIFVLHRPSSAENIGAVARAMKNFGLSRLAIVAPPSWTAAPRGRGTVATREVVLVRARKTALKASDLLDAASIHLDLPAALAQACWVCGASSRELPGRPRLTPRSLAAELAWRSETGPARVAPEAPRETSTSGGESGSGARLRARASMPSVPWVAVLFGEERRGLSDRELSLCHAVCTIPSAPAYDSLNLAQAAVVVAYELALAAAPAWTAQPQVVAEESAALEPARPDGERPAGPR